jgi:hypothetical protein
MPLKFKCKEHPPNTADDIGDAANGAGLVFVVVAVVECFQSG